MVQDDGADSVSLMLTRLEVKWRADLLNSLCRPGDLVTSSRGKEMQRQVWKEITESLTMKVPEVKRLASVPA